MKKTQSVKSLQTLDQLTGHSQGSGVTKEGAQMEAQTGDVWERCMSLTADSALALVALTHSQEDTRGGGCQNPSSLMPSTRALPSKHNHKHLPKKSVHIQTN